MASYCICTRKAAADAMGPITIEAKDMAAKIINAAVPPCGPLVVIDNAEMPKIRVGM